MEEKRKYDYLDYGMPAVGGVEEKIKVIDRFSAEENSVLWEREKIFIGGHGY